MPKEKDNKKVPFKVFSKKGLAAFALAGVMLSTPFALAGCGEAGPKGDTGATGTAGSNGKSAYELAVENGFTGTVQEWLESLKGSAGTGNSVVSVVKTATNGLVDTYTITFSDGSTTTFDVTNGADGAIGPQGPQGDPGATGPQGPAGISSYVGYDGYYWNGTERTEYFTNGSLAEDIVETTIGVKGVMSNYFAGSYIDLTSNKVALMANYMPTIKTTQYSGTTVTEVKVFAEETGSLFIGTAKVADIVNARINGVAFDAEMQEKQVIEGLNTIKLNLVVAEDETIVLGGGGSVGLYVVSGIPVNDEQGNFALLNSQANTNLIASNGTYADTLAIQVSAKIQTNKQLVAGYSAIDTLNYDASKMVECYNTMMPFTYSNLAMFENTQITKIQLFLTGSVYDNNDSGAGDTIETNVEYVFDISVVDSSSVVAGGTYDIKRTYQLKVMGKDIVANAWNEFDISDLCIQVAEGETLAFGSNTSTLECYYYNQQVEGLNYFGWNNATDSTLRERTTTATMIGVEGLVEMTDADAFENHLSELKEKEEDAYSKN